MFTFPTRVAHIHRQLLLARNAQRDHHNRTSACHYHRTAVGRNTKGKSKRWRVRRGPAANTSGRKMCTQSSQWNGDKSRKSFICFVRFFFNYGMKGSSGFSAHFFVSLPCLFLPIIYWWKFQFGEPNHSILLPSFFFAGIIWNGSNGIYKGR